MTPDNNTAGSPGMLKIVFPGKWFLIDAKTKIFIEGTLHSTHSVKQGFAAEVPVTGAAMKVRVDIGFRTTNYELGGLLPGEEYTMELAYSDTWGKFSKDYKLIKKVNETTTDTTAQPNISQPVEEAAPMQEAHTSNTAERPATVTADEVALGQLAHYGALHNNLTQAVSKKYRHSSIDLTRLADEIQNYFTGRKFGFLGTVTPTVNTFTAINGDKLVKANTGAIINTYGNSKDTAICVVITKTNDELHITCGMTGNYGVISGRSLVGVAFSGGASLVGNVASNLKDGQHIKQVMDNIDHLMHNLFREQAPAAAPAATDMPIPEKIKQLAALRDAGILTEEEFQQKKTELLARF